MAVSDGVAKVDEKAAIEKLTEQVVSMGVIDADMRLIASYAISKSGGECDRYNAADDMWMRQ